MLNYQRIGNSDYSSFDLDYQRKNRVTVSIHPKFNGFGIIVVAPNLRVRVTPPYDKCECFLHCFPLISVTNERKRAISEKLHGSVYFQPIPSELGNPVRKQGCKWGSGLLKSCLCFLTSKKHKQDCKQCGTTTWG